MNKRTKKLNTINTKNIKNTKIISQKINRFLQKGGMDNYDKPQTNKIKMLCCHGSMFPGHDKFTLPSGFNVIYLTKPNKAYYNINNTDNDIFNVLRDNEFEVNNLFDLGTLNKKEHLKLLEIKKNKELDLYKKDKIYELYTQYILETSQEVKTTKYNEIKDIYSYGNLDFTLHIGDDKTEINDIYLDFELTLHNRLFNLLNIPSSKTKKIPITFGIAYKGTKLIEELNESMKSETLKAPIKLSDLIQLYKEGTYLVCACRIFPAEYNKEEETTEIKIARVLSGIPDTESIGNKCICGFKDCGLEFVTDLGSNFCYNCNINYCPEHLGKYNHNCRAMCHHYKDYKDDKDDECVEMHDCEMVMCPFKDCNPICENHLEEHIKLKHSNIPKPEMDLDYEILKIVVDKYICIEEVAHQDLMLEKETIFVFEDLINLKIVNIDNLNKLKIIKKYLDKTEKDIVNYLLDSILVEYSYLQDKFRSYLQ